MPAHGTYEREQRTVTRLLAVGAMAEDWPKIKNRRTWRVFAVVRWKSYFNLHSRASRKFATLTFTPMKTGAFGGHEI